PVPRAEGARVPRVPRPSEPELLGACPTGPAALGETPVLRSERAAFLAVERPVVGVGLVVVLRYARPLFLRRLHRAHPSLSLGGGTKGVLGTGAWASCSSSRPGVGALSTWVRWPGRR